MSASSYHSSLIRSLCICGNLGMLIFLYILIWLFIVSFSLIHIFNCSVSFQAYGSHNFFSYPKTLLLWFLISSLLWTNRHKFLVRVRERERKMIVNQPLKPLPMGRKPKRGICMCVCVCVCMCVCVQHRWDVCVCDWVTLLYSRYQHHIVKQSSSVAQSCPTLREPMDCSTPGFLSITISQSLLKLMSIKSVMPSNCLVLCHPFLLRHSIFSSIRVFSNESVLHIR